ncbi:GNAT family N-acetyltransferase [Marinoscillum furvescens]|uniref:Uncharacterized protein n=1 Tax=Marinoscillum furvescens DSM 4134 TaxID=1122208 RepID=A0A3D9L2U7_MARFU|nr:GNAT family N-acetyltransferase [Marinoscillum furvescens]RED98007.1 hypothetical protein C7460_111149 [Marinoscillum furvescens DSM 4134]
MSVSLLEVTTKKQLKDFIKFQWKLYAGVKQFVPPILSMELSTLSWDKNPAFKHSKAKYWIAYKGKKAAGRIAGIIHGAEAKEHQKIRFGWIDFIDDFEVSSALIHQVMEWGSSEGLNKIHGPLGFTDLDFEGSLIEGFNQTATQATLYNFPYYKDHFEKLGFTKAVDWTESRIKVPLGDEKLAEDLNRKANIVSERYGMQIKEFKSGKEILKYADQAFELLNDTYGHLYGYYKLSDEQIKYFIDAYFGFVQKDFILMVVDENDRLVGFAITLPSLSKAFQKAKGHLYPFGFIHILKAFYSNDIVDFFLIAAKPEYQRKGFNALLWKRLFWACNKHGIKEIHSGQMLEENTNVNNLWAKYESAKDEEIRRRCFIRDISS